MKIEKAPKHSKDNQTISLIVKLQFDGRLKSIQDDYPYRDKIKYKSKDFPPEELWNAVKFHRYLIENKAKPPCHSFRYQCPPSAYMLKPSSYQYICNPIII